jgi:hypothetical protein
MRNANSTQSRSFPMRFSRRNARFWLIEHLVKTYHLMKKPIALAQSPNTSLSDKQVCSELNLACNDRTDYAVDVRFIVAIVLCARFFPRSPQTSPHRQILSLIAVLSPGCCSSPPHCRHFNKTRACSRVNIRSLTAFAILFCDIFIPRLRLSRFMVSNPASAAAADSTFASSLESLQSSLSLESSSIPTRSPSTLSLPSVWSPESPPGI